MINLIGPDKKKQFMAARRNSIWIRYIFLLLSTSLAILVILGGTSFYFYSQKLDQDTQLEENQKKLYTKEYISANEQITTFRKSLKTAKAVFDAETYYSVIITDVAQTMPNSTILSSLKLDANTFQTQQTLEFRSKTVSDAVKLKTAFEKNPPLSSEVRFSQITIANTAELTGTQKKYPVQITMFMKLSKTDSSKGSTIGQTPSGGDQ